MHNHSGCRFTDLVHEYSLEDLAAFHGHLGPYIVLGYRIGRFARENFCRDPFSMQARVFCSGIPPESCIVDGVQLGSGCTLGKRNIEIIEGTPIRCEFISDGKVLSITPRPYTPPPRGDDYERVIEDYAVGLFRESPEDLFSCIKRDI
jgi:Formylmethanofuran dehydrogenase subunit E